MISINCYTICIIVIFTIHTKAIDEFNNHWCKENVTRLLDDGSIYHEAEFNCCPGYTLDRTENCVPFCQRPCIHGFCKTPNVCECNEGYVLEKNQCVPVCKRKCLNGYCSKPDVCGCPHGFQIDKNNLTFCAPICKPNCGNFSRCTKSIPPKPNRCQCISGYSENYNTKICEPICKNKCHNGYCSAPETCGCSDGYELNNAHDFNCIPKCDPKCQMYSTCVAPNKCNCYNGYKLNETSIKCDPICENQVKNSKCVKPPNTWVCIENYHHDRKIEKCVLESCLCNNNGYCLEFKDKCECYEGFTKNITTGQCDSICQPDCENSICVAKNECQCLDGFHKTPLHYICEHNDLCNGVPCKNGECLITGACKCKTGYVRSFSYNGQRQCEKVQTFIRKVMITLLGIPILLIACILITIYAMAKKTSYNMEEQEMVLIDRQ